MSSLNLVSLVNRVFCGFHVTANVFLPTVHAVRLPKQLMVKILPRILIQWCTVHSVEVDLWMFPLDILFSVGRSFNRHTHEIIKKKNLVWFIYDIILLPQVRSWGLLENIAGHSQQHGGYQFGVGSQKRRTYYISQSTSSCEHWAPGPHLVVATCLQGDTYPHPSSLMKRPSWVIFLLVGAIYLIAAWSWAMNTAHLSTLWALLCMIGRKRKMCRQLRRIHGQTFWLFPVCPASLQQMEVLSEDRAVGVL